MILQEEIKKIIKEHALQEKPKECCGLIIEEASRFSAVKCRNISEDPQNIFSLSPHDYLQASRRGKIKALYHSHTNDKEQFSPYDKANSQAHCLDFILYNTEKNIFAFFDYKKNKTLIYKKPFASQSSDCYTLVKEHFLKSGVKLVDKNKSRIDPNWSKTNPGLIEEIFNINPELKRGSKDDLKKEDIFVFELGKGNGPVHVGIYLGDDTFMHHPRDKYPCIEPLNKIYKNKIYDVYRHVESN